MTERVIEALDSMSARDVERLARAASRRLQRCVLCKGDGAEPVRCRQDNTAFALLLCPACIERERLPEARALCPHGKPEPRDCGTCNALGGA